MNARTDAEILVDAVCAYVSADPNVARTFRQPMLPTWRVEIRCGTWIDYADVRAATWDEAIAEFRQQMGEDARHMVDVTINARRTG